MPPPERPRSARELLDQEEQQVLAALRDSVIAAGEDLCALDEVRKLVQRHPELALVAGAAAGAALAPLLARAAGAVVPLLVEHGIARAGGRAGLEWRGLFQAGEFTATRSG